MKFRNYLALLSKLKYYAAGAACAVLAAFLLYAFMFHRDLKGEGGDENIFVMEDVSSGGLTDYGSYSVSFKSLKFEPEKLLNMNFNAVQHMNVRNLTLTLNIDDVAKFKHGMESGNSLDIFKGFMLDANSGIIRGRMVNEVYVDGVRFEININGGKSYTLVSTKLLMMRGKPIQMSSTVILDNDTEKTYGTVGCTFQNNLSSVSFSHPVYLIKNGENELTDLTELRLF